MSATLAARYLFESLQTDLRALAAEAKLKKAIAVKEAADRALLRLLQAKNEVEQLPVNVPLGEAVSRGGEVLEPFLIACDTRNSRLAQMSVGAIHKLVSHGCVRDLEQVDGLLARLLLLVETNTEEVRTLQVILTLITVSRTLLRSQPLARAILMCFKLYFSKDVMVQNTAAATIRQVLAEVFERVVAEDSADHMERPETPIAEDVGFDLSRGAVSVLDEPPTLLRNRKSPLTLRRAASDAYMLFQDLCQLTNADPPSFLVGLTEMSRTFGLELIENSLSSYPEVFLQHPEFSFLLKERVCPLVIKLFSPGTHSDGTSSSSSANTVPIEEKSTYAVTVRLLRVVSVLVRRFYTLLVTESEIFLSMLVRFLEADRTIWRRTLAAEVIQQLFAQPELLRSVCMYYDMREHSAKIFQGMVNALSDYMQSLQRRSVSSSSNNTTQNNSHAPPLPGPLVGGNRKHILLDSLDKYDAPPVTEEYAFSVVFACLLELVNTVSSLVMYRPSEDPLTSPSKALIAPPIVRDIKRGTEEVAGNVDAGIWSEMVLSLWHGVLAAFAPLLASGQLDETGLQAVLKSFQTLTNLCGLLNLPTQRDAFVTVLCQRSLPSRYDQDAKMTPANIQCVRALLNVAHCLGGVLDGSAWYLVLETLMRLDSVLGLNTTSAVSVGRRGPDIVPNSPGIGIGMAKGGVALNELSLLSATLTRLFESSEYLSDSALNHMLDALCRLSGGASTSSESATPNLESEHSFLQSDLNFSSDNTVNIMMTELSTASVGSTRSTSEILFALSRLAEICCLNSSRVSCFWSRVKAHLLATCQHADSAIRERAVDALSSIIQSAMAASTTLSTNLSLQLMCLEPFQDLCRVRFADARVRQMEALATMLRTHGDAIHAGAWPVIFEICAAALDTSNSSPSSIVPWSRVVRIAFQSIELIIKDYLTIIPAETISSAVELVGRFLRQTFDMNICLTAGEMLWNMGDFLSTKRYTLAEKLASSQSATKGGMAALEDVWLILFTELSEGCLHERPEVRKSANQTLFATLSSHGSELSDTALRLCVWKIFFPLLERVRDNAAEAFRKDELNAQHSKKDKHQDPSKPVIIVHHTRDTATKQWDEMKVLSLQGVVQCFHLYSKRLLEGPRHAESWSTLLSNVQTSALSDSEEVALAGVTAFFELTKPPKEDNGDQSKQKEYIWREALKAWAGIAAGATLPRPTPIRQAYFVSLLQALPNIRNPLGLNFTPNDTSACVLLLCKIVSYPSADAFIDLENPSPLQKLVIDDIIALQPSVAADSKDRHLYVGWHHVLLGLIECVGLGWAPPQSPTNHPKYPMSFIPVATVAAQLALDHFHRIVHDASPYALQALSEEATVSFLLRGLGNALRYAHKCPKLALSCCRLIIDAFENEDIYCAVNPKLNVPAESLKMMWEYLASDLQVFLFGNADHPLNLDVVGQTDLEVAQSIVNRIVPAVRRSGSTFESQVKKFVALIERGSSSLQSERDKFTKSSFESLLRYSVAEENNRNTNSADTAPSTSSTEALMERCRLVIDRYIEEESQAERGILPPGRAVEVILVLKAMNGLVASIAVSVKDNHSEFVRCRKIVLSLYPRLVDCVTSRDDGIRAMVQAVLRGIGELLITDV